jgi:hypothetical protein
MSQAARICRSWPWYTRHEGRTVEDLKQNSSVESCKNLTDFIVRQELENGPREIDEDARANSESNPRIQASQCIHQFLRSNIRGWHSTSLHRFLYVLTTVAPIRRLQILTSQALLNALRVTLFFTFGVNLTFMWLSWV